MVHVLYWYTYLFVLVSSNGNKFGFLENIGSERRIGQLEDIVRPH